MFYCMGTRTTSKESEGEKFLYIPLCSLSTPVASKSGSPRLMSLTRVPTHSIWSTLHHSSASRSVEMSKRLTCTPSTCLKAKSKSPPCLGQTWFASEGLGGVVVEVNPYGMLLGALWQSRYVLHLVEFCNLKKNEQMQGGSHSLNERSQSTLSEGQEVGFSQMTTAWQKSAYLTATNYNSLSLIASKELVHKSPSLFTFAETY